MRVHLVDGTYELFRHYYAVPSYKHNGVEVAAVRGVVRSMLLLLEEGATHVGIATDHVIESFRNGLWPGYKSSAGVEAAILAQFSLLEEALAALGFLIWPMTEVEADDALASAAREAAAFASQVLICTPDKDLAQCVVRKRVVLFDRRKGAVVDEKGVIEKFGVRPESIPDLLALVGDSADGFPGLPGWGAKSAAAVLSKFRHIEAVPSDPDRWGIAVRGAAKLAETLSEHRDLAMLFKNLATLRSDVPVRATERRLHWRGPRREVGAITERLNLPDVVERAKALAAARA